MNTFFSGSTIRSSNGRRSWTVGPATGPGVLRRRGHQHDIVDEPDDARVEVDYFLVGTAPKPETDGEMSLARAAGLATELDNAKASADRWLGIRYGATSTPGRPYLCPGGAWFPRPGTRSRMSLTF